MTDRGEQATRRLARTAILVTNGPPAHDSTIHCQDQTATLLALHGSHSGRSG